MNFISMLKAAAVMIGGLAFASDASALGTCTVTGVTLSSLPYTNAALSSPGSVNWTCTRTGNNVDGTPFTVNFTAGAGLHYGGTARQVQNGANTMPYSLSTTSAPVWGDPLTVSGSTVNVVSAVFPGGNVDTVSGSFPFTFKIVASLNPVSGVTYSDIVSIGGTCSTTKGTACTVVSGTLSINVDTVLSCIISAPPGNVSLNYTSFQSSAATANASFAANCSNGTPYRMNVSPPGGTLLGLPYTLRLGTSAGSGTDISSTSTFNLSGTGSAVTYYVNGTIASGLSGTCSTGTCSATSTPHTLNVEY